MMVGSLTTATSTFAPVQASPTPRIPSGLIITEAALRTSTASTNWVNDARPTLPAIRSSANVSWTRLRGRVASASTISNTEACAAYLAP